MKSILISFNDFRQTGTLVELFENEKWSVDVSLSFDDAFAKLNLFSYDIHIISQDFIENYGFSAIDSFRTASNRAKMAVFRQERNLDRSGEIYQMGVAYVGLFPDSDLEMINEIKRLTEPIPIARGLYVCNNLVLDLLRRTARRDGKDIILRNKEFNLLALLMRNTGQVLTRDQIIHSVWDEQACIFTNTVDVHIHSLRKKVDSGFEKKLITTVPCVGYKFG